MIVASFKNIICSHSFFLVLSVFFRLSDNMITHAARPSKRSPELPKLIKLFRDLEERNVCRNLCLLFLAYFGDEVFCHCRFAGSCVAATYQRNETSKHTYIFLFGGKGAPGLDKKVNIDGSLSAREWPRRILFGDGARIVSIKHTPTRPSIALFRLLSGNFQWRGHRRQKQGRQRTPEKNPRVAGGP